MVKRRAFSPLLSIDRFRETFSLRFKTGPGEKPLRTFRSDSSANINSFSYEKFSNMFWFCDTNTQGVGWLENIIVKKNKSKKKKKEPLDERLSSFRKWRKIFSAWTKASNTQTYTKILISFIKEWKQTNNSNLETSGGRFSVVEYSCKKRVLANQSSSTIHDITMLALLRCLCMLVAKFGG